MHPLVRWILVALAGATAGCGRTSGWSSRDAAAARDAGATDLATRTDLDTPDNGVQVMYSGVVLAMLTQDEATTSHVVRAVFAAAPHPTIGGCPRCCCASTERGLPLPHKPPDAGRVTVAAAAGGPILATLVPASGSLYGMSDLGWTWFAPLSNYAPANSLPWKPGDTLQVLTAGNEVQPISGLLQAGPALAGVTPSIGRSTVAVERGRAFEVTWTPAGNGDGTVLLSLAYSGGLCHCDAPDAAGKLVVDANLLNPTSAEQYGTIKLSRLTIASVTSGNASVDLVGAVVQTGPLTVQ